MSSTPAADIAAKSGAAAPPVEPVKVTEVPTDLRKRVLGGIKPPVKTQEQIQAEKEANDLEEKKKKDAADAESARKAAEGSGPKVKKVKAGPDLPEKPPASGTIDQASVEAAVRKILPSVTTGKTVETSGLAPDEIAEVEFAKFAESKDATKYAGMGEKVAAFYRDHSALRADKAKELGGVSSPEFRDFLDSDEYKGWIKEHRPAYARGDRDKLQNDIIAERASAATRAELQPEISALQRKTIELEVGPQINAAVAHAAKIILTDPADKEEDKDPALQAFAADPKKFAEEHPTDAAEIASVANGFGNAIREVYRIDHDLVDLNVATNPLHGFLRDFSVQRNDELAAKHPTGLEMGDGKILIDAKTYHERGLKNDPRYRTFNSDELAGMLAATGQNAVKLKCADLRQRATKSIYTRPAKPNIPGEPEKKTTEEAASPTARSSAASGSAARTPPGDENKGLGRRYA